MEEKKHSLVLTDRKELNLTGILSVVSFQEESAELESTLGFCQITGSGLHMEKLDLDKGEVILKGQIISIYYPSATAEKGKNFFQRLLS